MSTSMTPPSGSSGQRSTLQVRTLSEDAQTPEEIEAEIELQREQLAGTIDALSAKLDVKSQAQARVEEAKHTAQAKVAQVKHAVTSTAGSAQAKVGTASGTVGHTVKAGTVTSSGRPRPELLAFGITVLVATAVLWWRER